MQRTLYAHSYDNDREALASGRWFPAAGVIEVPQDSLVLGQVISTGVSPLVRAAAQLSVDRVNWSKPVQWPRYKATISKFGDDAAAFAARMPAVTPDEMTEGGHVLIRPGIVIRPDAMIAETRNLALYVYVRTGKWVPGTEPLVGPGGKHGAMSCAELATHISNLETIIAEHEARRDTACATHDHRPPLITQQESGGVEASGVMDLCEPIAELVQMHRADLVDAESIWAERNCGSAETDALA